MMKLAVAVDAEDAELELAPLFLQRASMHIALQQYFAIMR